MHIIFLAKWLSHSFNRKIWKKWSGGRAGEVLMLFLAFSLIKLFICIFSLFFFNNARKSCAPFIEMFFLHDKFLHGKILSHNPSLQILPHPKPKIPLKTSVNFSITITIWKHWSKFITCSPSHGVCGGVSRPQRHSY